MRTLFGLYIGHRLNAPPLLSHGEDERLHLDVRMFCLTSIRRQCGYHASRGYRELHKSDVLNLMHKCIISLIKINFNILIQYIYIYIYIYNIYNIYSPRACRTNSSTMRITIGSNLKLLITLLDLLLQMQQKCLRGNKV